MSDDKQGRFFSDLPPPIGKPLRFRPHERPLWTENKAKLIERYLYYFVLVTKHGAYIDGFAAPQDPANPESWAAKQVLESKPQLLREFWLCDLHKRGVAALRNMVNGLAPVKGRTIEIVPGDFNRKVSDILSRSSITEKTASFCLIDQRTFECAWSTVQKLAVHKRTNKIELFYFFPSRWLDRALEATRDIKTIIRWWGNSDWSELRGMNTWSRAFLAAKRFKDELGYAHVYPFPIYDRGAHGRLMYHMIHATDHPEAPKLMNRAYYNATKPREPLEQLQMELKLLGRIGFRPPPTE